MKTCPPGLWRIIGLRPKGNCNCDLTADNADYADGRPSTFRLLSMSYARQVALRATPDKPAGGQLQGRINRRRARTGANRVNGLRPKAELRGRYADREGFYRAPCTVYRPKGIGLRPKGNCKVELTADGRGRAQTGLTASGRKPNSEEDTLTWKGFTVHRAPARRANGTRIPNFKE